jgi:hypothetical protein
VIAEQGRTDQEDDMTLDHQEARAWADHHKAFSGWIGEIAEAFRALARVQYDQPWKRDR